MTLNLIPGGFRGPGQAAGAVMTDYPTSQRLIGHWKPILSDLAYRVRTRSRWRLSVLAAASLIFLVGACWSARTLVISPADLNPAPLAPLAFLVALSVLYGGMGLWLLARSAGRSMPLTRATVISSYAYLAEMLPLPGGAVVRAGALVRAGATVGRSSSLVLLTAILWISLAMLGAGLTLLPRSLHLAVPLLLVGGLASGVVVAWLWTTAGAGIAMGTLFHRIAGILLTALRLTFAFAALNASIGFSQTFPFVLAILLGSASSLAPAGLGISESLAALAATASDQSAGIAFLAVGIDRLFCLGGCALLALWARLDKTLNREPKPDSNLAESEGV